MIKALVLEHFWVLFGIAVVASAGTFFLAMQRRTQLWLKSVKVVPIVFAILLAINYFVVTPREAIGRQLDKLLDACEAGNVDQIAPLLDGDMTASGMNKAEVIEQMREIFGRMQIDILRASIENNPPPPLVKIGLLVQVKSKAGSPYAPVTSQWEITYRKPAGDWLIYEIRPISLQGQSVQDVQDVLKESRQVQ